MGDSSIEWTKKVWNPVTGCTKISPGCAHCYAETFAERWRGIPGHPYEQGFDLKLWPARLTLPLAWKKPQKVFVNSMSDLFHKDVPDSFIDSVFRVMIEAERHTFQVLTKRAERQQKYMDDRWQVGGKFPPPKNVWLGVSVENQAAANERVPLLLRTPAFMRWVSAEPLLGPVDFSSIVNPIGHEYWDALSRAEADDARAEGGCDTVLDWVVVGGESGPGARPFSIDWAVDIVDQCARAGVAVFVKQLGKRAVCANVNLYDFPETTRLLGHGEGAASARIKFRHPKGGDPAEWPEPLRVREFPAVSL